MAENEFYNNGQIKSYMPLRYTDLTADGGHTNKYTLIHRESASAVTQHRFGRGFDDVMYMLDNGREP